MRVKSAIFFFLILSNVVFAQKNLRTHLVGSEQKGDNLFYLFSYNEALSAYKIALKQSPEEDRLELKLAETYRLLNMPERAAEFYAKVIDNQTLIKPIHNLHFAQSLSSTGQYDEAKIWYEKYRKVVADDSRSLRNLKNLEKLSDLFKDSSSYHVNTININSEQADFSPAYYKGGIVFVSSREPKKGVNPVFNWNKSHFLDLYYSREHEDGTNASPERFHKNVNTQLHEGPTAFYADGSKMIFTRNNLINGKKGESSDGIIKLKLYLSQNSEEIDAWSKPVEFPFNSDEYSVGHPTITNDGATLYFASDMPNGYGGTDIYKSIYENGQWGEPQNLGKMINTEGNEMFPFFHEESEVLYFSSNGHGGLGGLDVFSSKDELDVKNLGYPINTKADDFGFILAANGQSGYLSSNRPDGKGDDDIYHFRVQNEIIDVLVYDQQTGDPLPSSFVELHEGSVLAALSKTNPGGGVFFQVSPKKNYLLKVYKKGYQPAEVLIDLLQLQTKDFLQVKVPLVFKGTGLLASNEPIKENYKQFVFGGGEITEVNPLVDTTKPNAIEEPDKAVETLKSIEYYEIANITNRQDFVIKSDDLLLLEGNKFSSTNKNGQELIINTQNPKPLGEEIIIELKSLGYTVGHTQIKNIYYDLDKSLIRNDASVELDKVVNLLSKYPQLKLRLSAHADSRGSQVYNKKLALRRSEAAKSYLVSEGIAKERISAEYFGEQALVNDCADGADCTEQLHQLNRRTEINIEFN